MADLSTIGTLVGNDIKFLNDKIDEHTAKAISKQLDGVTNIVAIDIAEDTDGGAWIDRAISQSWYTEVTTEGVYHGSKTTSERDALTVSTGDMVYNSTTDRYEKYDGSAWATTYRGVTRKMPKKRLAVACTLSSVKSVVLFDITRNQPEMWMVFQIGGAYQATNNMISDINRLFKGIVCVNNHLIVTLSSAGIIDVDFTSDEARRITYGLAKNSTKYNGDISERNSQLGETGVATEYIVSNNTNAVDATVLEDAPLDKYGMPVLSWTVSTAAGESSVKNGESVYDITDAVNIVGSSVDNKGRLVVITSSTVYVYNTLPTADTTLSAADATFTSSSIVAVSGTLNAVEWKNDSIVVNSTDGVFTIQYNETTPTKSLLSHGAKEYNTGYMFGDTVSCIMPNVSDTALSGSEKVTNGTFDTDTDWTKGTGWSIDTVTNFRADCDGTQTADSLLTTATIPTTVVGQLYVVTFEVVAYTAGNVKLNFEGTNVIANKAAIGVYSATVTATTTTGTIDIVADLDFVGSVDNVSLREAVPDRSVKNNAVQIYGNLTLTSVASGAELKGIGGWSDTNYLEIPYNSSISFGLDDFCINVHKRLTSLSGLSFFFDNRDRVTNDTGTAAWLDFSGNNIYFKTKETGLNSDILYPYTFQTGVDYIFTFVRRNNGTVQEIYLNGELLISQTVTARNLNDTTPMIIGSANILNNYTKGIISYIKISKTAPTPEQIKEMYLTEKEWLKPDAKITLQSTTTDEVKDVSYDELTDTYTLVQADRITKMQGLTVVDDYAPNVSSPVVIDNKDGIVVEGGATAYVTMPKMEMREHLLQKKYQKAVKHEQDFWFDSYDNGVAFDGTVTGLITLSQGWKPKRVQLNGSVKREGSTQDYIVDFDGFLYSINYNTAIAAGSEVLVTAERVK